MSKVIITAALNGLTTHRGECASVPFLPDEIAAEAQRATEAGASVIHVHAREDGGAPSYRSERYYEVVEAIRERCSALVSISTGAFGVPLTERLAPIEARPELATLPMGSMNYARYNAGQRNFDYDHVFSNPFSDMLSLAERMRERRVRMVASCYDIGHIASADPLSDMGVLEGHVFFNLCLGVTGGIPATTHNLARMVDSLPTQSMWQLTATGNNAWHQRAAALSMGGHLRVGFEDGNNLPNGEPAESNGTLVGAARQLAKAVGMEIAEPSDVRALLALDFDQQQ